MGARVSVLGASGFAGAELLRLLAGHGEMEVVAAAASTRVGIKVSDLFPHFGQYGTIRFVSIDEALSAQPDLIFSSLPHNESMKLFGGEQIPSRVVDLAGDFRLSDSRLYPEWYGEEHSHPEALESWVYGLTEFHRKEVSKARLVANPGCYPSAALLALLPLAAEGLIRVEGINISALSGVSGAGRAGGEGFDFSSINENSRPYGVVAHKHIPEIEQELSRASGGNAKVTFVPHLVPMTRGIIATCIADATREISADELIEVFAERYSDEPFISALGANELPETKRLAGTNNAEVTARFDSRTGKVIAISAIDNLGKGAAGQAIQNSNLMLGLPETTGLTQIGLAP